MKYISPFLIASSVLISAGYAEILKYEFDDGTLQGWTDIQAVGATSPRYAFSATTATIGDRIPADRGTHKVMVYDGTDRRSVAHATAILRSPTFTLPPSSSISARLLGSRGKQSSAPANQAALGANSVQDHGNGYAGIALRRTSDGAYLLYGSRTSNAQSAGNFQTVGWNAAQLAAATSTDAVDETYTLDFIDNVHADWGWVAMDSVEIDRGGAYSWASQAEKCFKLTGIAGKGLESIWSSGSRPSDALTVETWVNVASSSDMALVSLGSAQAGGGFVLRHSGNGPYIQLNSELGTTEIKKTNRAVALKTGAWKHVAVSWSKAENRVRIFVDGHLYHDKIVPEMTLSFPNTPSLFIGSRLGIDGWMNASLDEVRVWDIALSQKEIQNHMHEFRVGDETGLIALHALNGFTDNRIPDLSSQQRHLFANQVNDPDFAASFAKIPDNKPAYRDYVSRLDWQVKEEVRPGMIRRAHQFTDLFGKRQSVHVLEIDPVVADVHFEMAALPDGASYRKTSSFAQERKSVAAVNGSYWHTSGIISDSNPPRDKATRNGIATFTRVNGEVVTDTYEYHAMPNKYFGAPAGSVETVDVDYADDGAVVFDGTGADFDVIPRPKPHDSSGEFVSGWKDFADWDNAMASGPLLLQEGDVVFHYRNSYEQWNSGEVPWTWQNGDYPFTAAGVKEDGKVVLVVGDGRSSTSEGLSVEEVAHLMMALDCENAIRLDGGGSTTMYVEGTGVVNSPSDGSERSVPSALLVVPNDVPTAQEPPLEMNLAGPVTSGDLYYPIQPLISGSLFISAKVERAGTTWSAFGLRTGPSEDTSAGGIDIGRNTASTGFSLFDYLDHKGGTSAAARKAYTDGTFNVVDGTYQLIGEVDYDAKVIRAWITDGVSGTLQLGEPMIVEPFTEGFTSDGSLYLRLGSGNSALWSDVKVRRATTSGERSLAFAGLRSPANFTDFFGESFTTLGITGTTPPTGWSVWNGSGDNGTWRTSIAPADVATMTMSSLPLTVATPPAESASHGYNAGLAESPENRMLGSVPTTTAGAAFQLELTNGNSHPLTAISVAYDIQRFTAASSDNELPGFWLFYSLDNGATWANASALNPALSGNSGVVIPNSIGVTKVPATSISLSAPWVPGSKLLLRWVDDNARSSSPDQIYGLDNVIVRAANGGDAPIVPIGSVWKYLDNGTDQGTTWRQKGYDDSAWKSGPAQMGYGDGDEATVLTFGGDSGNKIPGYFFRHSFDVVDASVVKTLAIRILRDDGAVVYLNGQELFRDNMPAGDANHLTYANGTVDSANERAFFEFNIPATALVNGENVIAVSIHQDRPSSSDISFDFELSLVEKPDPNAPVFNSDLIVAERAVINGSYTGSLADFVTDGNGDAPIFTKISGPDWLTVAPDGTLSGTPGAGDIGISDFVVSVTDYKDGTTTAVIRIEVGEAPEIARAALPGSDQALRFGIVPDTQGSTNGVPTAEAQAVTGQLLAQAPEFVIHVGDVTDGNGTGDAKLGQLSYFNELMTQPLLNAGINIYPVRGNHDSNIHTLTSGNQPVWKVAFPHLFQTGRATVDPTNVPGGNTTTPNNNNYSYVIDAGNNTFLIALDIWQGGSNANYPAWVAAQMASIRAIHPDAHIFCFSHSGLFSTSSHPAMTEYIGSPDDFIAAAKQYGIDGWFSGHNHIFDRSMATDEAKNNQPSFFNMTVGSASSKFYGLSRSPVAGQHVNRLIDSTQTSNSPIAYQMVGVNGPFVMVTTYMSPKNSSGGFTDWSVWDELTYSNNGAQFSVPQGGSYNEQWITHTSPTTGGSSGTTVRIIDGVNNDTTTHSYDGNSFGQYRNITLGWTAPGAWYESERQLVSDVVSIHGMRDTPRRNRTDPYTVTLSYNASSLSEPHQRNLSLVSFLDKNPSDAQPGEWLEAAEGTLANPVNEPQFRAPRPDDAVGTWGIDLANQRVWARLDYQGDFAIASNVTDVDRDGLADEWEILHFGSLVSSGQDDPDGDGVNNLQEQVAGTHPNKADSDDDMINDGEEIENGLDPLVTNTGLVGDIIGNIKSNPDLQHALGLYTKQAFGAIRGEPLIEVAPDGNLRIGLQPMQSDDFETWLEFGEPLMLTLPVEGEKRFFQWFAE